MIEVIRTSLAGHVRKKANAHNPREAGPEGLPPRFASRRRQFASSAWQLRHMSTIRTFNTTHECPVWEKIEDRFGSGPEVRRWSGPVILRLTAISGFGHKTPFAGGVLQTLRRRLRARDRPFGPGEAGHTSNGRRGRVLSSPAVVSPIDFSGRHQSFLRGALDPEVRRFGA